MKVKGASPAAPLRRRPVPGATALLALLSAWLLSACAPAAARTTAVQPAPAARAAEPAPFLWRIQGTGVSSYLFGTIHLPDPRVLELHPAVEAAFAASDAVYTEIPMDLATTIQASTSVMLEGDTRLRDLLPPDLYERAGRYLASRQRDIDLFARFKVWKFTMDLSMLDDFRKYLLHTPMDLTLASRARAAGKLTGGLETVEEQLAVFESLTLKEQIQLLEATLDELERLAAQGRTATDELVDLYLRGDAEALRAEMEKDADDPLQRKFLRLILTERDERMAERAAARMRGNPGTSFFFAVGAAHCVGREGIPVRLRRLGFRVSRIRSLEELRAPTHAAADRQNPAIDPAREHLFRRLNEERRRRGLAELAWNPVLARLAAEHAEELRRRGELSHRSAADGAAYADRLARTPLRARRAAENLAQAPDAEEAHLGLMASPGHRGNILDPDLEEVGIGVSAAPDGDLVVVQDFAALMPGLDDGEAAAALAEALQAAWRAGGGGLSQDAALARRARAAWPRTPAGRSAGSVAV